MLQKASCFFIVRAMEKQSLSHLLLALPFLSSIDAIVRNKSRDFFQRTAVFAKRFWRKIAMRFFCQGCLQKESVNKRRARGGDTIVQLVKTVAVHWLVALDGLCSSFAYAPMLERTLPFHSKRYCRALSSVANRRMRQF